MTSRTSTPESAERSRRRSRRRRAGWVAVAVLRLDEATNGGPPEGERRAANLEDVFVLLTGEEIA